ncbi:MAG: T9SS type A sorting domain-containing protein [candidate division Zixibacteria bacterium]|nr:T9SS type A sorting domain-containing protein [candidate division Zixibacteria bacterium]
MRRFLQLMILIVFSIILSGSVFSAETEEATYSTGLVVPEEAKLRFQELDNQPPPVLLNTEEVWDWRYMNGVTPVKNQGSCGSCWDFAATGAFESAIMIEDSIVWDLSEQHVLDCNWGGSSCNGGWMNDAYAVFADYGAEEEICYPYRARDLNCGQDTCVVMMMLDTWEDIPNNVDAIKNALLEGPVSSTFTAHDGFYWDCYEDVYTNPNHAVVIVGWDDDMCGGQGAWITKNSWGNGWGDEGYFYMPFGSCGLGHFTQRPIYVSYTPQITSNPDTLYFDLPWGGEDSQILQLGNIGDGDIFYRVKLNKADYHDEYGYLFFDSESPHGPDYNWIDISSYGQIVDIGGRPNNSNSGPIDLGFDFNFYGNSFNSINICSKGWISFTDSTSYSYFNRHLPHSSDPNNLLAVFWEAMDPELGGNIYYSTNSIDTAIVSWVDIPDSREEGLFTFQVVLVAPDKIVFQYDSMGPGGPIEQASIGIENEDGSIGLEVCYNELFTLGEKAVEFEIGIPCAEFDWLSIDDDEGNIYPTDFVDLEITCSAGSHNAGTYWGVIEVYNNDPENKYMEIPVMMNVGTTSVDETQSLPKKFVLTQNFPNPFNPVTDISYALPEGCEVRIDIYNILGQHVTNLVDGLQQAGQYSVLWDASDNASGLYFYKLTAGDKQITKRMTLLK